MDRVELMRRAALEEDLTEEETMELQKYMAEVLEKTQMDPRQIEKMMWRGVKKEDRRMSQPVRSTPKVGRNAPCPCGCCGAKYKNCCGAGK